MSSSTGKSKPYEKGFKSASLTTADTFYILERLIEKKWKEGSNLVGKVVDKAETIHTLAVPTTNEENVSVSIFLPLKDKDCVPKFCLDNSEQIDRGVGPGLSRSPYYFLDIG